jgi:hypothetical protein
MSPWCVCVGWPEQIVSRQVARFRCFLARQVVLNALLIFKEDIKDKTVR